MRYLDLLLNQNPHKLALITDFAQYTYGDLIAKAQKMPLIKANYTFIHENLIVEQLSKFLAYSGTKTVPIIATQASKHQDFTAYTKTIPPNACMGVMTSGSTGKSKLLWRNFASWADFFPEQNNIFGINKQSIIFCQGSLAFTGNLNIYLSVLAAGGTIVATEKFAPKTWLQMIIKNKVNCLYLIPSKLLLLPKILKQANLSIKHIISGSQSMGKPQANMLKKIFPNAEIILYYGASELNYITYIKDKDMTEDITLIGKPFNNVHICIDKNTQEILVHTPYHIEQITLPFSLKDRGYIDKLGNLHYLGRSDDIINLNGMKISLYKIEHTLRKLLPIKEIATKIIHTNDIDQLVAFIVTENKLPINKVEALKKLKPYLSEYEIPKKFICLANLPKNESGKIDKQNLFIEVGI